MTSEPLNVEDLEFLNTLLLKYGNDDAILDVSELDGFLTAIVSGPDMIPPSTWYPEVWGGNEPEWEDEAELRRFTGLLFQFMNNNATTLMEYPEHYEAMFTLRDGPDGEEVMVVEEWCFGYMRGVALGDWSALPRDMRKQLSAIELHGTEENFDKLDTLTLQEHQQTALDIAPAVRALHAYWLSLRSRVQPILTPHKAEKKVGRNDPCPCGSGRKFKKCCLH